MDATALKSAVERLVALDAVSVDGDTYRSADGHRLTFYLGKPGQAMVLGPIESFELAADLIVMTRASDSSTLIVTYDAVHGVATTPPEAKSERRTGFS